MTRTLTAATSGWGKSWLAQQDSEKNLQNVDYCVIADYKDEFRGLVKAGFAQWLGVGSVEIGLSAADWAQIIQDNRRLVCARSVDQSQWREWVAKISTAVQEYVLGSVLVVIDEAHFVAPQKKGYPEEVGSLATTGRGNEVASTWVTQRAQMLDETIISQCDERMLGGFTSKQDRNKIQGVVPYDVEVHDPTEEHPPGLWDSSLQKYEDEDGGLTGSEWIYSNSDGDVTRFDSRELSMQSEHYGGESVRLDRPA
jgi:hypothetical protein